MMKNLVVTSIAVGAFLIGTASLSAETKLEETRSTLKQWVETKKIISEEESDWKVEKQILDESIQLLEDEIQNIQDAIASFDEEASAADRAREDLTAQDNELKAASAIVRDSIGDLEAAVLDIVDYLPPDLKGKLDIVVQRIPTNNREIAASTLANRVVNIVGILGEIEKFNSQLTVANETREIGGSTVRVDTLYVGLSIAYYVDGTGTEAGYLVPAKGEWKRVEDPSLAEAIADAVAMNKKEMTVDFVKLPFTVTEIE